MNLQKNELFIFDREKIHKPEKFVLFVDDLEKSEGYDYMNLWSMMMI
jgi:hypothetical protein